MTYKIYFYDEKLKSTYPIRIKKKSITALAIWLNSYVKQHNTMHVVRGEAIAVDRLGNDFTVGDVSFLPSELIKQVFLTNLSDRLLAYYRDNYEEV